MQQIYDGFPYLFHIPETGAKAIVCLCEKVGSTAWKATLIKALNAHYFSASLSKPKSSSHQNVPNLPKYTAEDFKKFLNDSTIPRFMFVRNPFSRVISGWTDKTDQDYYATFNRSMGFEKFVYHLRDNRFSLHREVNDHFYPLVNKCLQFGGITYDYFLKVEQMDYWYGPFIRKLKLEGVVSSGWEEYHAAHRGDSSRSASICLPEKPVTVQFRSTLI